jgi:hypothetical protein
MLQIKVTLKELQEKCKSYGKTYGKKEVILILNLIVN